MKYLVIGNGRVGGAFASYCEYLGHQAHLWSRANAQQSPEALAIAIGQADILAIATPDAMIDQVWTRSRALFKGAQAIHFSGALQVEGMFACHPLYSFPKTTLAPERFATIAIAQETNAPPFAEVVPGAKNPTFVVNAADRAYYHALAVISGNYAAHIWNLVAERFEGRFAANAGDALTPYFRSIVARFEETPLYSMTGPIARKDAPTVAANLQSIASEPELEDLYKEFLAKAWPAYLKRKA